MNILTENLKTGNHWAKVHGDTVLVAPVNPTIPNRIGKGIMDVTATITKRFIVYFAKLLGFIAQDGVRSKNTQKLIRKKNY